VHRETRAALAAAAVELDGPRQRLAPVRTRNRPGTAIATVALALIVAAIAAGCSAAAAPELAGREFVAQTVTAPDPNVPLVVGTQVRMRFSATELSFSTGCNTMGGTYSIEDGTRLVLGNVFTTEMGCDPARHAADEWLSRMLGSGPSVRLIGTTLAIDAGSTQLLLEDREVAEPDALLVGPTWTLESISSGDAVSSVPGDLSATIVFHDDGTLDVNTGCNSGSGPWSTVAGGIQVGALALSKKACEKGPAEVESAIVTVLGAGSVSAAIDGPLLTLQAGAQGLVLRAGVGS
jgi:heat shock protein HslJ